MKKRPAARVFLINPQGHVLLFRFVFADGYAVQRTFWGTVGGAKNADETFEQAARRELQEEVGLIADVGAPIFTHTVEFQLPNGDWVEAEERFFVVHCESFQIDRSGHEAYEREVMQEARWWSMADLQASKEPIFPERICEILEGLLS